VAPVHADEVDRAVARRLDQVLERPVRERTELSRAHLPRGHREFAVADPAEPSTWPSITTGAVNPN
jgi:hypothetical protein